MKKRIAAVLCLMLLLGGCTRPSGEPTGPAETEQTPFPTVSVGETLPGTVVPPGEMPPPPQADAELPPQPTPPVVSE